MVMLEKSLLGAMNAKVAGSGETTLILSHGYGGSQSVWDKMLPGLTQRYRVVVFDWSFSGAVDHPVVVDTSKYSSFDAFSDELISLIDEMSLKDVVFVGHSMAGMIGCIASIKRPDLFMRLLLLGASPRYLNSKDYEGGFEKADIENILSNIESNFQAWAQSFVPLAVGANDPISIVKVGSIFQKMRPDIALSVARTIFLSDLRDVLEKVEVPCTIIQTTNDIVVPVSVAHYMQGKIKGETSLEIMESDGHFPQLTAHQMLIDVFDRVLMS